MSSIMEGTLKISDESRKEVVFVRLADVSGVTEEVQLSFDRKIENAYEVNLKGDILGEIPAGEGRISVMCKANKIITIAVEL